MRRTGHTGAVSAGRRSGGEMPVPRTYLRPLGTGLVHIQWHHPDKGIGCLTVIDDGTGNEVLEPWDDCSARRPAQQFRIEPLGASRSPGYRLRPGHSGRCLGIADDATAPGTEVVHEPCIDTHDQEFLVDLLPPPR